MVATTVTTSNSPIQRLRAKMKSLAPYMLHLAIVVGVAVYVVIGALAIREIEAIRPNDDGIAHEEAQVARLRREEEGAAQPAEFSIRRAAMNRTRRCVLAALHRIQTLTNCSQRAVQSMHLNFLDSCYDNDIRVLMSNAKKDFEPNPTKMSVPSSELEGLVYDEADGAFKWRFTDSILFCFTVITTIGYGNVAPKSFNGRLFVIVYGLIGVPCTMLAIANLGKFLAALLKSWGRPFVNCFRKMHRRVFRRRKHSQREKQRLMDTNGNANNGKRKSTSVEDSDGSGDEDEKEQEDEEEGESTSDALVLFISFVLYIIIGSIVISSYERQMNFFEAIYFNFVTLTTIGLGDLVPQSERFLVCTLLYCAVGLALTTIAIEIAADYLKKLHYFGRKLDNVGTVQVWFGGQKLTMKQLVKNLGDQFGVPVDQLENLNMDQFVEDAMRVEAGELATLRRDGPPYSSDYWRAVEGSSLHFVDDDDVVSIQANRNCLLDF